MPPDLCLDEPRSPPSAHLLTRLSLLAAADHWIIGRRVGEREFYMLLDQRQYTLAQANGEIDRLCSTFFNNIYM